MAPEKDTTSTLASEDEVLASCAYLSDIRIWPSDLKSASRRWLGNFAPEEKVYACALLEAFVLFSDELVTRMFISAFDEVANEISEGTGDYADRKLAWESFKTEVLVTHPTGEMPNVTDSGYMFDRMARQRIGIDQTQILTPEQVVARLAAGPPQSVVFVDDFVGSGDQFTRTWNRTYQTPAGPASFDDLSADGRLTEAYYLPLICSQHGANVIKTNCPSVNLRPTHELFPEYAANHPASLVWPDSIRPNAESFIESSSDRAGIPAAKRWGYKGLGLTLAFEHGVPDATLPIFYWEENGWRPLVKLR